MCRSGLYAGARRASRLLESSSGRTGHSIAQQRRHNYSKPGNMESKSASPLPDPTVAPIDYSSYSAADLIYRITHLENQLRLNNIQLAALQNAPTFTATPSQPSPPTTSSIETKIQKKPKAFDPTRFTTRLIALKLSYMGQHYNGYEHANGNVHPKPTIEEVLWKALRKARLISPPLGPDADDSTEILWDSAARLARYASAGEKTDGTDKVRLELNWEGCEYSKCGRTDRGVSAFGQVVGVRVRSNRLREVSAERRAQESERIVNGIEHDANHDSAAVPPLAAVSSSSPDTVATKHNNMAFDDVADELPYLSILNAILPPSIRILAWSPSPPTDFDARFSCKERRYKYFFTNPAFLPTPGPLGMKHADGRNASHREGWLDIDRMRMAAKKLVGSHDYRNLCKIDPSKQMSSCERRISHADVRLWDRVGSELTAEKHLNADGEDGMRTLARKMGIGDLVDEGPRVYAFEVHGSAFLWHQVRCMVAVLFLVGQGLEEPEVVDRLLDMKNNPRRPMYEMADDGPLVLWDCVFEGPEDGGRGKINWIYAGDEAAMASLTTKHDSKFGLGGLADTIWTQWRKAKLEEMVTSSLLDLVLEQGDGSPLLRGGFRDPSKAQRSAKVFEGGDTARAVGKYVPVANKTKMDTLEAQNERYRNGRQARKDNRLPARAAKVVS
jgi:tRNA pseudouridine38/39 synthase